MPPMDVKPLPLQPWAREFARRWNSAAYSVFLISGNIFDIYAVHSENGPDYVPLKSFLLRRLFPDRSYLMFYDIGDGLSFATKEMQQRFMEWLKIFDTI